MSEREYIRLGKEIEALQTQRTELLHSEFERLTGAKIGDLVRDRKGRRAVIVSWEYGYWPHSRRDFPWVKARLFNKDGSLGDRTPTFFEWTKESPADERDRRGSPSAGA
jgi:hypothetical protein